MFLTHDFEHSSVRHCPDGEGGAFIVWRSGTRLYAQWIDRDGTMRYPEAAVIATNVMIRSISVAKTGLRRAMVCWNDSRQANAVTPYLQLLSENPQLLRTEDIESESSGTVRILSMHPQPTVESAQVTFSAPVGQNVRVTFRDQLGRTVKVLLDRRVHSSITTVRWDAQEQRSGVYFCVIQTPNATAVRKVVVTR